MRGPNHTDTTGIPGVYGGEDVKRNPEDTEKVFVLLDGLLTEGKRAELTDGLLSDPRAAAGLAQRPTLGTIDLSALAALPQGTLGRAFADFLMERELDPTLLTDEASEQEDYVTRHLFETHDVWHVVTGMDTDIPGELGLQAFYMAQLPGTAGGVLIALALLRAAISGQAQQPMLAGVARGWQLGRTAAPLAGVDWAARWEQPLDEVRASLNIN